MICVQKMRMKREEHYSVYRAILIAQGVEDRVNFFFWVWKFFCEKIPQILDFVNIKVAPAKFFNFGFYCTPSLF